MLCYEETLKPRGGSSGGGGGGSWGRPPFGGPQNFKKRGNVGYTCANAARFST